MLAYQFGSSTHTERRAPPKDVDVALLLQDKTSSEHRFQIRLDVADALQKLYRYPVDVVVLNTAHIVLVHQVLKCERLLYGKADQASQYMVQSLTRYFDYLPLHQFFAQHLSKRLGASRNG
jgi:hypothetical protein